MLEKHKVVSRDEWLKAGQDRYGGFVRQMRQAGRSHDVGRGV
jgi:hypothetical protein